jgi:quercetin dioxygenase-like cupin family protein
MKKGQDEHGKRGEMTIRDLIEEKRLIMQEIQSTSSRYFISKDMPMLNAHDKGFSKFDEGVLIKDIASPRMKELKVTALETINSEGYASASHRHDNRYEIFLVINGKVELIVDGEVNTYSTGEAVMLQPDIKHEVKFYEDTRLVVFIFPSLEEFR